MGELRHENVLMSHDENRIGKLLFMESGPAAASHRVEVSLVRINEVNPMINCLVWSDYYKFLTP